MPNTPRSSPETLEMSHEDSFIPTYLAEPGAQVEEGSPVEQRWIRENNNALATVFAESDTLGKLIAKARWIDLKLTREQLADMIGLNKATPLKVELLTDRTNPTARTHHHTYARIVHMFDKANVDPRIIRAILDELLAEDCGTTIGLEREWMYRSGMHPKEFADQTGLTYGALWQRRAQQTIPSFAELLSITKKLGYVTEKKPEAIWQNPEIIRARNTWINDGQRIGRSRSVSTIHALFACHGYPSDGPSIKQHGSDALIWDTADTLATFGLPSWDAIKPFHTLAQKTMTPKEFSAFKTLWNEEYQSIAERKTYSSVFKRLQKERGITNNKMARVCGITSPKPSHIIREVIEGTMPAFNHPVSRGELAVLLTQSLDGKHVAELRALDSAERNSKRDRQSSTIDRNMRNVREWWGLLPKDLEKITGFSHAELLRLERNPTIDKDLRIALIEAIEKEGHRRAQNLLTKWKTYEEPPTVVEAITRRSEDSGGYEALARIIKPGIPSPVSPDGLKRMISSPPSLPLLTHIVESSGARVTDALRQDWSHQYAERLIEEGNTPLIRVLKSIIAEHVVNIRAFCNRPSSKKAKLHPSAISRFFQKANTTDQPFDPSFAFRILEKADVSKDSPRWRWIECLSRHKTIETALQDWIRMVDVPSPLSYQDLPGLTKKEWEKVEHMIETRRPREVPVPSMTREEALWEWLNKEDPTIVAWRITALQKILRHLLTEGLSDSAIKTVLRKELDIRAFLYQLKPSTPDEITVFESYIDGSLRLDAERLRGEGKDPLEILPSLRKKLSQLVERCERFSRAPDQSPAPDPIKLNPSGRVTRKKASY